MAPIDSNNNQNTVRRAIWGYIYTLNINMRIEGNSYYLHYFTRYISETWLVERVAFIKKRMYSLVNYEKY